MKLVELIGYLADPKERLAEISQIEFPVLKSEAVLVYMRESLDLGSDIYFFRIEDTGDEITFEKNGVCYIQLFPVDYIVDLLESDLRFNDQDYSDLEIAQRLLDYRLSDA